MKRLLLKLFSVMALLATAMNGYSSTADVTTVVQEEFSGFTEGSVETPGTTDIGYFLSGKLGDILTGWKGSKVYEAGGCLFIGSGGNLQTSTYPLNANGGVFKLTFKAKGTLENGNSISYQVGYNTAVAIPLKGNEWQTVSVLAEKGSASSYIKFNSGTNGFYIDDLLIETSPSFIVPPVAKQPTRADETSFTASWTGPLGATGFILEVYTKGENGTKEYFSQQDLASYLKSQDISGLSPDKNYYYTVRTKNANGTSDPSNEIEVIKVITSVATPVAKEATNITKNGFTANWEATGKAELFIITLMNTETLTHAKAVPIISEDFSGIKKGTLGSIEYGSSSEDLNVYTQQPGWGASPVCFAAGYMGVSPTSGKTGTINTPKMDLSRNNGAFTLDIKVAEVKAGGTIATGANIDVVLYNKDKVEKEKKTITLDKNSFNTYTVDFTMGMADCYLEIRYTGTGTNKLLIDELSVKQRREVGDKIVSINQTVETKEQSHLFNIEFKENFTFGYNVKASIRTVNTYGNIIMLSSAASETIEVVSPAAGDKVVVDENFSAFTEGSDISPATIDISSTKLTATLPGWSGSKVFEAGGALALAGTGFLQTATYDLSGNNGIFKVTFRVKGNTSLGSKISVSVNGTVENHTTLSSHNFDWHTVSFISENGDEHTPIKILFEDEAGAIIIDDLKIESNKAFIKAPVAKQPTQANGSSFTASWNASKSATAYMLDVYTLSAENVKEYLIQEELGSNVLTKEVNGLAVDKKYFYTVKAKNETAVSDFSNEIEVIKIVTTIGTPVVKKATNVTQQGLTANWEKQDAAGYYTVILSSQNKEGGDNKVVDTQDTDKLSYNFKVEVRPEMLYSYQVKANVRTVNDKGEIIVLSSPLSDVMKVDNPVTEVTVVLEEDFAAFTNGSTSKPGTTDISGSKLAQTLPQWSGKKIFESGGSLHIGGGGYLQTPSYDLSGNQGIFKVTISLKAVEEYGNLINCLVGGVTEQIMVEDNNWHTISFVSENGKGATSLKFSSLLDAFFIDDVKIETSPSFIKTPEAKQPAKADRTSFTANWTGAKNATHYLLDVYTKGENGTKEYFLQVELPATNKTKEVTGLSADKTYFYTVRAKNNITTSEYSEEIEVVRVVKSLNAPVAKAATSVSKDGFTANWEKNNDADYYTVTLVGTETLLQSREVSMLAEDFSGINEGTFSHVEFGKIQEYLDEYTKTPGWFAINDCYAKGHIGLSPFGTPASITTPGINLSQNNGKFSVKLTMAEMLTNAYKKGGKVDFILYNGDQEVEKKSVTITEEKFTEFKVDFTKGNEHSFIKISYNGTFKIFIDKISVDQTLNHGDKVSTILKVEETKELSLHLDAKETKEFTFGYFVTASVRTVDTEGYIYILTSDTSELIEAVSYVGIENISETPHSVYTRNNEIIVLLDNEEQIEVYSINGQLLFNKKAQTGENSFRTERGQYLVKVGNKVFKVVL